jgi:hypothetical protein
VRLTNRTLAGARSILEKDTGIQILCLPDVKLALRVLQNLDPRRNGSRNGGQSSQLSSHIND